MKTPSYRQAVAWIALNDNPGDPDAQDAETIGGFLTVGFAADLFDVDQKRVAADVVAYRQAEAAGEAMKKKR
jgi:hypothetical protein